MLPDQIGSQRESKSKSAGKGLPRTATTAAAWQPFNLLQTMQINAPKVKLVEADAVLNVTHSLTRRVQDTGGTDDAKPPGLGNDEMRNGRKEEVCTYRTTAAAAGNR